MLFSAALYGSEVYSLRRFLNRLLGTPPAGPAILIDRDAQVSRPFIRLTAPNSAPITKESVGWYNGLRSYVITYAGLNHGDVFGRIDEIRHALQRVSHVPFYVYGGRWFRPTVRLQDPNGDYYPGTIPPGPHVVTCTVVNRLGEETLASVPSTFSNADDGGAMVYVPIWPVQGPRHVEARVYLDGVLAGSQVLEGVPVGHTPVMLGAVGGSSTAPPVDSTYSYGTMRVESVSTQLLESDSRDGEYDGVVSVVVSRELFTDDEMGYRPYVAGDVVIAGLNETGKV